MKYNYSLPIRFDVIMEKGQTHPKVDLYESVRQHLFLMLATRFGENRFDPHYGCPLWENDFDNLSEIEKKKHEIENDLKALIRQKEPRLTDINVTMRIDLEEFRSQMYQKVRKVKKKVEIQIKGKLKETNRPFDPPPFTLYFSPVSVK